MGRHVFLEVWKGSKGDSKGVGFDLVGKSRSQVAGRRSQCLVNLMNINIDERDRVICELYLSERQEERN
jgi:hypothetical protein